MPRPVSMFSPYATTENSVTNSIGIVLRSLYRESPLRFAELLNAWGGFEQQIEVGPTFAQQERGAGSVPDLVIEQKGIAIRVETKLGRSFGSDQLSAHVDGLVNSEASVRIVVALGNHESPEFLREHRILVETAHAKGVHILPLSFEGLVTGLSQLQLTDRLREMVDELSEYLGSRELLPRWRDSMTIVNTVGTFDEFEQGAYACPDSGGNYRHDRVRYFAAYRDKAARLIAQVRGRVIIDPIDGVSVDWIDTDSEETRSELARDARAFIAASPGRVEESTRTRLQVFVLGPRYETSFVKDSSGGMSQSRRYFWDIAKLVAANDAEDLASKLRNRRWSEFGHR